MIEVTIKKNGKIVKTYTAEQYESKKYGGFDVIEDPTGDKRYYRNKQEAIEIKLWSGMKEYTKNVHVFKKQVSNQLRLVK